MYVAAFVPYMRVCRSELSNQLCQSVCLSVILLVLENHKTLCLALEYIKNCHSGVLFIALGGSVDQIFSSNVYKV